jgi:hypothetical protein
VWVITYSWLQTIHKDRYFWKTSLICTTRTGLLPTALSLVKNRSHSFGQFLGKICHFWPKCWIGIGWCLVLVARDWYFGYYLFLNLKYRQYSCKVMYSFSHQNKMTQLFRFLVEFFIPYFFCYFALIFFSLLVLFLIEDYFFHIWRSTPNAQKRFI